MSMLYDLFFEFRVDLILRDFSMSFPDPYSMNPLSPRPLKYLSHLEAVRLEGLVLVQHFVEVEVGVGDGLPRQPGLGPQEVREHPIHRDKKF